MRGITWLIRREHVRYQNHVLPPSTLRTGGPPFQDNAYYLSSAENEVRRLVRHFDFNSTMRLLDIGCGSGRLAIGILSILGNISRYHGIDVSKPRINWCVRHISAKHPDFLFTHIDVENSRYNPYGQGITDGFSLPLSDGGCDIVYLYSVFSHMTIDQVDKYLEEIRRVLSESGHVFFTAFVEKDVPDMSVNPENYRRRWSGPLHCVRYERSFFDQLLRTRGFFVDHFEYGMETDGQSAYYLKARSADAIIPNCL